MKAVHRVVEFIKLALPAVTKCEFCGKDMSNENEQHAEDCRIAEVYRA